mmetsp:Transcript_7325/g.10924  ORF Transcript_7325/g.10924 Transcript_7325/m.10924 type:complete len:202 (+) Transcript_7325:2836-3441(+)
MDTQGQIAGQSPRRACPGQNRATVPLFSVVFERKRHDDGRVPNVLVIQAGLEIRKWSGAGSAERHDLETFVNESFLVQRLKNPPYTFHKFWIHRLVIVVEVDPSAQSRHRLFPLRGVPQNDAPAMFVVLRDAHRQHIVLRLDSQFLVNFVLDGKAVAVPSESSIAISASLVVISSHCIFDGASQNMAIMWQASCKGWSIIE